MLSQYFYSLDYTVRKRYLEKLKVNGETLPDPYGITEDLWLDDVTKWPSVEFGDLYTYLIDTKGPFTKEKLKAYKSLEAYSYFHDGYVRTVQGQLMVCEKDFCDFVVWTPKGIFIQRIFMDSAFRERLIKKLTTFYVEQFLPQLMTHHLQCAALVNTSVYCFCQKEEHSKMIECENPTCKSGWFHFSCIGLKRPPKRSWYCPECNS